MELLCCYSLQPQLFPFFVFFDSFAASKANGNPRSASMRGDYQTIMSRFLCDAVPRALTWGRVDVEVVALPENGAYEVFGDGWAMSCGFFKHEIDTPHQLQK